MKRIALISFAVIAALVSCQKEGLTEKTQTSESLVFTASITSDQTKTTLSNDNPAKIYWESTDKITITDASSHVAVYKLSAGEGTTSGTFVKDSGDDLDSPSTYTASYGASPSTNQIYSASGSVPLYMTAPETSSTDGLKFTAQCGVLRVTLTDATHKIMRVEVSDGTNTYKVTSASEVTVTSATDFYLALPAGSYTSMNIYDDKGQMVSKTGISLVITAGHVKPASNTSTLSFADCTTKGFNGVHAVVQLWSGGPFWAETNIGATIETDYGQHFAWGYSTPYNWTGTAWSPSITFDSDGFPDYKTHAYSDMAAANWGIGWSVPTKEQFSTLINTDSSNKCSVSDVTTGIKGIKITGNEAGYTSNSIFIPAAGFGSSSSINQQGNKLRYWSSSNNGENSAAMLECIPSTNTHRFINIHKYYGYSVRPVRSSI